MNPLDVIIELIEAGEAADTEAMRVIQARGKAEDALVYHRRASACTHAAFWLLRPLSLACQVTRTGDKTGQ